MTHLPLTLGEYRTARGVAMISHIGKHGKWAFDAFGDKWHVATGEHYRDPSLNIIARHDPDAELARAMVDDGLVVPLSWSGAVDPIKVATAKTIAQCLQEIREMRAELAATQNAMIAAQAEQDSAIKLADQRLNDLAAVHVKLIDARAERDEAVALLRSEERWRSPCRWIDKRDALIAKIGGK